MSINRQVPKLRDVAFDALAKLGLFRTEFEVTVPSGIPLEIHQNGISSLVVDMARERLLPRLLHWTLAKSTKINQLILPCEKRLFQKND